MQVELENIVFKKTDLSELVDKILLGSIGCLFNNPVIVFLAEKTGFSEQCVSDAFNYLRHFDRWSRMPFAELILNSNIDAEFWWKAYDCYDKNGLNIDYKKMFEYVTSQIDSLDLP